MSEENQSKVPLVGRVGLQQRVLPTYRLPFFRALATALPGGLAVFAGQPRPDESITALQPGQTTTNSDLSIFFATNHHFLSPSSSFYLCWQADFPKWLDDIQPEALVVEANPRLRSTPRGIQWMHARGRPVVGWGLGAPNPRGLLAAWRKNSWPRFLQQFDALVAYSSYGAEQYRKQGFPPERIFIAPNAVTHRPSTPPPARPIRPSGPPKVLFVGRLQERKRVDNLLHAAASLPESIRPHLQIVGDGPARADLQVLAQKIYPNAEFAGERAGQDLESFFHSADLFVLPGTGGLAVQQAMAHALPVIAAQGDGTLDTLVRPDNGWRVPADDLPALTETLNAALSDFSRLRRMGDISYKIVSEEVNLENMVRQFLAALSVSVSRIW